MNPAIAYLTSGMTPIQGYHRTGSYTTGEHNRLAITETSFTVVAHVGRDTRRQVNENYGSRQAGALKLQTDDTQALLVTMKEAASGESGKLPDVIVWMGVRYMLADVEDLSANPIPMLRTRTYSLVRENPA